MNIVKFENEIENYIFTTPVNKILSKVLEIDPYILEVDPYILEIDPYIFVEWEPPKQHGLSNSERIIPNYYKIPDKQIPNIDYYDIIKDDIRNYRSLNNFQLKFIMNLEDKYKNEILVLFNTCMASFMSMMEI